MASSLELKRPLSSVNFCRTYYLSKIALGFVNVSSVKGTGGIKDDKKRVTEKDDFVPRLYLKKATANDRGGKIAVD